MILAGLLLLCAASLQARDVAHSRLHRIGHGIVPLSSSGVDEEWCVGDVSLLDVPTKDLQGVLEGPMVVQLRLPSSSRPVEIMRKALPQADVEHLGSGSLLVGAPGMLLQEMAEVLTGPLLQHAVQRVCLLPRDKKHLPGLGPATRIGMVLGPHECIAALSVGQSPLLKANPLTAEPAHGGVRLCCRVNDGQCTAPPSLFEELLHHAGTYFVEHQLRPSIHSKFSRGILQSRRELVEPFSDVSSGTLSLTGKGYIVGVADTGIDTDHCFFFDPDQDVPFNKLNKNHRKIVRYTTIGSSANAKSDYVPGHGTHVCGTVAGSTLDPNNDVSSYHGIAPNAKITFTDLSGDNADGIQGPPIWDTLETARQDGARVHSNSWGSEMALYTSTCKEIDGYMASYDDMLVIFSAGNSADARCTGDAAQAPMCDRQTVTAPSTAKNVLSVGATQGTLLSWRAAFLGNYVLTVTNANGAITRFNVTKANFGPKTAAVPSGTPLIQSETSEGCKEPTASVAGALVVMQRGTCHFSDKSILVQGHKAAGVLVINTVAGDPIVMGCGTEGDSDCGVTVPTFMASKVDGATLLGMLAAGSLTAEIGETTEANSHKNEENLSSFSSHGPTADFRFKPDLVAVGELVHNAYSDGDLETKNCGLWATQGTSMAAPMVAGLAILLQEYFAKGIHARGEPSAADGVKASSALVKAALIHCAEPLRGLYDRNSQGDWRSLPLHVSFEQGHGRPVLNESFPHSTASVVQVDIINSKRIKNGEEHAYCVMYNGKASAFKATLVWHDPASTPLAALTLINNLDLTVRVDACGSEYHGNVQAPNTSVRDVLNNAEKVSIVRAAAGLYRVLVSAAHVPDGDQPYALVVSGKILDASTCPRPSMRCAHGAPSSSGSACICERGWFGPLCSLPVPTLSQDEEATVVVAPAEWQYFRIVAAPSDTLTLTFSVIATDADVDLIVCSDRFPTLADREGSVRAPNCVVETTCDNCSPRSSPATHSVTLSLSSQYFVGLAGMCCYPSNVSISVGGKTATPSLSRQHLLVEQSATVEAHLMLRGSNLQDTSRVDLLHSLTGDAVASCPASAATSTSVAAQCPRFECGRDMSAPIRLAVYARPEAASFPDTSVASVVCSESYFAATPSPLTGVFVVSGLGTGNSREPVATFLILPPTALLNASVLELVGTNASDAGSVNAVKVMNNRTNRFQGTCRILTRSNSVVRCAVDSDTVKVGDVFVLVVNGLRTPAAFAVATVPSIFAIATTTFNASSAFEQGVTVPFLASRHATAFSLLGRGLRPSVSGIFPPPAAWAPLLPDWQSFSDSLSVSLRFHSGGALVPCSSLTAQSDHEATCMAGAFPISGKYSLVLTYALGPATGADQAVTVTVEAPPLLTGLFSTAAVSPSLLHVSMSGDLSLTIMGTNLPIDGSVDFSLENARNSSFRVPGNVFFRDSQWVIVSFANQRGSLRAGVYSISLRFGDYAAPADSFTVTFDGIFSLITGLAVLDDVPTNNTHVRGVALYPGRAVAFLYGSNLDLMVDPLVLAASDDGAVLVQAAVLQVEHSKVSINLPLFLSGDVTLSFYFSRDAYVAVPSVAPVTMSMTDSMLMRRPSVAVSNVLFVGSTVSITVGAATPTGAMFLTNRSECYLDASEGENFAFVSGRTGNSFNVTLVDTTDSTIVCLCDEIAAGSPGACFWRRADLPLIPTAIIGPSHMSLSQSGAAILDDTPLPPRWFEAPLLQRVFLHKPFTLNISLFPVPPFVGGNDGNAPFYLYLGFDNAENVTYCNPSTTISFGQADDVDDQNTHFGFGDLEIPQSLRRYSRVKICAGLLREQMVPELVDRKIFVPLLLLGAAECIDEADCSHHGQCIEGSCRCDENFRGERCSTACPVNSDGVACSGYQCDNTGACLCGMNAGGLSCDERVVRWTNITTGAFSGAAEFVLDRAVRFAIRGLQGSFLDVFACRIDDATSPPIFALVVVSTAGLDLQSRVFSASPHSCAMISVEDAMVSPTVAFRPTSSSKATFRVAFASRAVTSVDATSPTEALSSGMMTGRPSINSTVQDCSVLSSCGAFFVLVGLASACIVVAATGIVHAVIVGRSLF